MDRRGPRRWQAGLESGLSNDERNGVAPRPGPGQDGTMSELRQLRVVALAEGVSFLALLLVAMPLKYLAGLPLAVRVVGLVHGVLFLAFLAALLRAASDRGWPAGRSALAFLSAIVPFGTFVFDRSLRREIAGEPGRPIRPG
jgi:integral membrane protein